MNISKDTGGLGWLTSSRPVCRTDSVQPGVVVSTHCDPRSRVLVLQTQVIRSNRMALNYNRVKAVDENATNRQHSCVGSAR